MGDVVGESATDGELVMASLADPQKFGDLFDRHGLAVHRYVASRARRADIDDMVSETFITAFRTRARYDREYDDARPWLLGIATNVLRHHYRSEHRRLARLRSVHHAPEPAVDLSESVAAAVDGSFEIDRIDLGTEVNSTIATETSCCWRRAPTSRTKRSPEHWVSRSARFGRGWPVAGAGSGNYSNHAGNTR